MNSNIHLWYRTFAEIYKKSPEALAAHLISAVWRGIKEYPRIFLWALLLDSLITRNARTILAFALSLIGCYFISSIITALIQKKVTLADSRLLTIQRELLSKHAAISSYEKLNHTETRDKRSLIFEYTDKYGVGLKSVIGAATALIETSLSLIICVSALIVWLGDVSILSSTVNILLPMTAGCVIFDLILVFGQLYIQKVKTENRHDLKNTYRIWFYLDREYLLFHKSGKEVRVFNQRDIIKQLLSEANQKILAANRDEQKKLFLWRLLWNIRGTIFTALLMLCLGVLVLRRLITIGQFTGMLSVFRNLNNSILTFCAETVNRRKITEWLRLFWDYCDYMAHDAPCPAEQVPSMPKNERDETIISADKLCYRYDKSDVFALRDITVDIKRGEHVAIVGRNGSGKTTFIMQLCGLLEPTSGLVTVDGQPICDIKKDKLYEKFGIIFQDFKLVSLPLGENIAVSENYDRDRVLEAMRASGLNQRFDDELDTYLFKKYDPSGIDVSGGEQQKIALARVIYRDAEIVIMDEPTAALDPISEYNLYNDINRVFADKTVIFISHRLSSCRFCDRILVFDKGTIVQQGSHESLISDESGLYAALWNAQAQYYQM